MKEKKEYCLKNEFLNGNIKDAFSEFIFRNKAYRDQIENEYNQNINVFSTNKFEFEDFLETPFLNKDIVLRVHQKNAIFKGIMQNTLLLDHQVGAGKTLAGIALVWKKIRMNLIKKALILVPNHLSSAWAKEFIKAYPSAKILVGDKIDNKKARKEFLYRARNGDFDAIIMKHSTFENMNVMQSFQEEVIEEQMKSLSIQLADKKRLNETIRFKDTKRILEEIDKQINRFKMKLANLAKGKTFDDEIAFEDLGIDCLIVDEAHYFKKIYAFS